MKDLIYISEHIKEFDSKENLKLVKTLYDISENEKNTEAIRDLSTDLMLFCEGIDTGPLKNMPVSEIKNLIKKSILKN